MSGAVEHARAQRQRAFEIGSSDREREFRRLCGPEHGMARVEGDGGGNELRRIELPVSLRPGQIAEMPVEIQERILLRQRRVRRRGERGRREGEIVDPIGHSAVANYHRIVDGHRFPAGLNHRCFARVEGLLLAGPQSERSRDNGLPGGRVVRCGRDPRVSVRLELHLQMIERAGGHIANDDRRVHRVAGRIEGFV